MPDPPKIRLFTLRDQTVVLDSDLATIYGVLPVPSRVSVAASLLDTMVDKTKDNSKMGIVSYLATHHYYLWSPLEKSVVITMAGLGLSYGGFMALVAIPLALYLVITYGYIAFGLSNDDLQGFGREDGPAMTASAWVALLGLLAVIGANAASVLPDLEFVLAAGKLKIDAMAWSMVAYTAVLIALFRPAVSSILGFINVRLVFFTAAVIALGWYVGENAKAIEAYIATMAQGYGLWAVLGGSFLACFAMGSSARYAAMSVVLTKIFGMPFFLLFFVTDYIAYLLSPVHKCVVIGKMYFGTSLVKFYGILIAMSVVLFGAAVAQVFLLG